MFDHIVETLLNIELWNATQDNDVSLFGLPEALELLAEISMHDQVRRWLKLVW